MFSSGLRQTTENSAAGKDRRAQSFLDDGIASGIMSRENLVEQAFSREHNKTTNLESGASSRLVSRDLNPTSLSNLTKTYQELEKELQVRKEQMNKANILRNNFIDPSELPLS